MIKIVMSFLFIGLLTNIVCAQEGGDKVSEMSSPPSQEDGANAKKQEFDFFRNTKTYIKDPFLLRDPFKRTLKRKGAVKSKRELVPSKDGVFSNVPTLDGVPISNIRIVGVLLGKERRAIAKTVSGNSLSSNSYILREGMKLGIDGAELKAILPGGIVLVEKIRNVYDQDEYLETIIPVTTE